MITEGIEEIDEYVFDVSSKSAKEISENILRAIEEANDHRIIQPVTIMFDFGHKQHNSMTLRILPEKT